MREPMPAPVPAKWTEPGSSWSLPFDVLPHPLWCEDEWITSPDTYPVYRAITETITPHSIAEIGSLAGYSLIAMLAGTQPGQVKRVVSVDNETYLPGSRAIAMQNVVAYLRQAGYRVPELHSFETVEQIPPYHLFDVIHVDGDHTFDGCWRDLVWAGQYATRAILVDDVQHIEAVHRVVERWCHRRYCWLEVDSYRGLAVVDLTGRAGVLAEQVQRELPPYWTSVLHRPNKGYRDG